MRLTQVTLAQDFSRMDKRNTLPPLNALRVFECAARHESFRLAAEELSISQSAISHQITNLEDHLGVALFQRTGRNVRLTEAAKTCFPHLTAAFENMSEAMRLLRQPQTLELTVQIYITMAARWMMPRLHRLQRQHPGLIVRFNASQLDWEFDPRSADIGIIRILETNKLGIEYVPLFEAQLIAVCSPSLFKSHSHVTAADIANQTRLEVYPANNDWDVWLNAAGITRSNPPAAIKFDSYLLAMEAASEGQGIAIVPEFLAESDLKSDRLVQPVPLAVPQPEKWYLAAKSGKFKDPAAAQFRDWLLGEIGERE
jgi:LysR family transcriptional regulator, glycine cleavage system transcriptional activator